MPRVHGIEGRRRRHVSFGASNAAETDGTAINSPNKEYSGNISSKIQPVAKSTLEQMEFSSKSFSVPVISSKAADIGIGNVENYCGDFVGIAPPLHGMNADNHDDAAEGEVVVNPQPEDSPASWLYHRCSKALAIMQTDLTTLELSLNILNVLQSHDAAREDPMEEVRDENQRMTELQHRLFIATDGGKRDFDLVFDVCARREELRAKGVRERLMQFARNGARNEGENNDSCENRGGSSGDVVTTENNMSSLTLEGGVRVQQETNSKFESADRKSLNLLLRDEADPTKVTEKTPNQPSDLEKIAPASLETNHTMDQEQCRQLHDTKHSDVAHKKPRSRHKKRPASNDVTVKGDTTNSKEEVGCSSVAGHSLSKENTSIPSSGDHSLTSDHFMGDIIIGEDKTSDFPIHESSLEMQDDIEWSFVRAEGPMVHDEEVASPSRRVTRSMQSVASSQSGGDDSNGGRVDESESAYKTNRGKDKTISPGRTSKKNEKLNTLHEKEHNKHAHKSDSSISHRQETNQRAKSDSNDGETDEKQQSRSRRKRNEKRGPIRVMFTGINPTLRHKEMVSAIGGELLENVQDAANATHIIVSDGKTKLRRTPKLMICISSTSKILNIEWLEQSCENNQILDTSDFLHVNDTEAEQRYDFSMSETISNGIIARRRGGVLGGWWIYVCNGVAGNRAPSMEELQLIIEAAGGTVLRSLSDSGYDPEKTIILTSDPSTSAQLSESRQIGVPHTTSWLFHTIITQRLYDGHASFVRCGSEESVVSALTASPGKRPSSNQRRNAAKSSSRSSRNSRKDEQYKLSSNECSQFLSRDQFLAKFSPLADSSSCINDEAALQTHTLWVNYFNELGARATTPKVSTTLSGVRCRRGRKRTRSPMITCTLPPSPKQKKTNSTPSKKLLPSDNEYVSWEAYVLFTLGIRAAGLKIDESLPSLFPTPQTIQPSKKTVSLIVETSRSEDEAQEQRVFGTLKDVFDLHQKYQTSGPIPESTLAQLAILAVQAVSTMHSCGVVHNDLSLDSFLVVRRMSPNLQKNGDGWHLLLIGFGYKSLILNCRRDSTCEKGHFEQDYRCLANVLHYLITGGMDITFTEVLGKVEFTSKAFIKGNLFMRGALSWCALFDALLGIGDDFDPKPIQLQYPFDVFGIEESYSNNRLQQIVWSCRMLYELASKNTSLSTFLEGLRRYNPRFILPSIPITTYICHAKDTRQSFILCAPPSKSKITLPSNASIEDIHQHQLAEKEAKLKSDALLLARREVSYNDEISEIHCKLQQIQTMQKSCAEAEHRIQQREHVIETQYANIQKLKEELLARERLLEHKMQQLSRTSGSNDLLPEAEEFFECQMSPCHSTQARSSVCSSEDGELGSSSKKKRRRRANASKSSIPKQYTHSNQNPTENVPSTPKHFPNPRPSEHLCSLQNLSSPAMNTRRTSSITKPRRKISSTPSADGSVDSQRKTKRVFIDIGD